MDIRELLVGKTLEEAGELLRNWKYRIKSRDGVPFILTQDYKPERLNLGIKDNKIASVSFG